MTLNCKGRDKFSCALYIAVIIIMRGTLTLQVLVLDILSSHYWLIVNTVKLLVSIPLVNDSHCHLSQRLHSYCKATWSMCMWKALQTNVPQRIQYRSQDMHLRNYQQTDVPQWKCSHTTFSTLHWQCRAYMSPGGGFWQRPVCALMRGYVSVLQGAS
jgi:hypothetical protein